MLYSHWTLPLCLRLHCPDVILCLLLLWHVGSSNPMFWLVLRSHGTWSGGLIQCCIHPLQTWSAEILKRRCRSCSLRLVSLHQPACPIYTLPQSHRMLQTPETVSPKSSSANLSTSKLFLAGICIVFILNFPSNVYILYDPWNPSTSLLRQTNVHEADAGKSLKNNWQQRH
jgi:hypothetical protein